MCLGNTAKVVATFVELVVVQPVSFSCRVLRSRMAPSGRLKDTVLLGVTNSLPSAISWRVLLETFESL